MRPSNGNGSKTSGWVRLSTSTLAARLITIIVATCAYGADAVAWLALVVVGRRQRPIIRYSVFIFGIALVSYGSALASDLSSDSHRADYSAAPSVSSASTDSPFEVHSFRSTAKLHGTVSNLPQQISDTPRTPTISEWEPNPDSAVPARIQQLDVGSTFSDTEMLQLRYYYEKMRSAEHDLQFMKNSPRVDLPISLPGMDGSEDVPQAEDIHSDLQVGAQAQAKIG